MYVMDTKIDKRLFLLRDELSSLTLDYLLNTGNKVNQNKRLLTKGAVSCFLLNSFYKAMRGINKSGITLNSNHYSVKPIVNGRSSNRKVSYLYTRILLDYLAKDGYIILHKGGVGEYGIIKGKWQAITFENGYVEFTDKLINLYKGHQYQIKPNAYETDTNVLIVRDEKGRDVTFAMNNYLRERKAGLDTYNTLSVTIQVGIKEDFYDVQMHKVLNGKTYTKGGRNCMKGEGIQNLSKQQRKRLTINGNPTVIYDYQGFEPSIAYSMCQELSLGDPYTVSIDGYDPKTLRKICKLFLLIMFNIKNPKYIHGALNSMIRDEFDIQKLYEQGKIPDKRINIKELVGILEDKHYLIKHMFYGNSKTEPSFIGSMIADYITDYFTQRGILVLSVFDEFIIEEDHESELIDIMSMAYESILGFTDNCNIRKEK